MRAKPEKKKKNAWYNLGPQSILMNDCVRGKRSPLIPSSQLQLEGLKAALGAVWQPCTSSVSHTDKHGGKAPKNLIKRQRHWEASSRDNYV